MNSKPADNSQTKRKDKMDDVDEFSTDVHPSYDDPQHPKLTTQSIRLMLQSTVSSTAAQRLEDFIAVYSSPKMTFPLEPLPLSNAGRTNHVFSENDDRTSMCSSQTISSLDTHTSASTIDLDSNFLDELEVPCGIIPTSGNGSTATPGSATPLDDTNDDDLNGGSGSPMIPPIPPQNDKTSSKAMADKARGSKTGGIYDWKLLLLAIAIDISLVYGVIWLFVQEEKIRERVLYMSCRLE